MIPLLNAGTKGIEAMRREAAEMGVVMDTQTAKAAEQFNDDLSRFGFAVRGFGNDLMRAALPSLQAVATAMLDLRRNSVEAATAVPMLTSVITALTLEGARSSATIFKLGAEMGGFLAKAEVVARGLWESANGSNTSNVDIVKRSWDAFRAISDGVKADVDRAQVELRRLEYALSQPGQINAAFGRDSTELARRGRGPATPPQTRAPIIPGGGASAVNKAAQYLENLRKQLDATQELTVAEKLLSDIRAGSLGKVTATQEKQLHGHRSRDRRHQGGAANRHRARRGSHQGARRDQRICARSAGGRLGAPKVADCRRVREHAQGGHRRHPLPE